MTSAVTGVQRVWVLAWPALAAVLVAVVISGCSGSGSQPVAQPDLTTGYAGGPWRGELFNDAITNLNRLEEFAPGAMLQQIVERLNQWVVAVDPPANWTPDAMISTLPAKLAGLEEMQALDRMKFSRSDGAALQEAVWARSVAQWARGDKLDDLARAQRLFDWTIRNIQLSPDQGTRLAQLPWETLLYGRGSALERAWVYVLLCQQQGLDAALLLPGDEPASEASMDSSRLWAVAVLIGREAYLFDPALGLPIPTPGGISLGASGLEIRPATLVQTASDSKVLEKLNIRGQKPYGVQSAQASRVTVLLAASPEQLSRRMRLLESRIAGRDKVLLTVSPSSEAERWRKLSQVARVRLWTYPLEVLSRLRELPPELAQEKVVLFLPFQAGMADGLWKGRLLQLKGRFVGEDAASACYQAVRPSNSDLARAKQGLAEEYLKMEREAAPNRPPQEAQREAVSRANFEVLVRLRAKHDASYWLGLIAYERGNWASAIDYLANRTLAAIDKSPWKRGAHYNLGRAYEASGQPRQAVAEYRWLTKSLDDRGAALRGQWLAEAARLPESEGADAPSVAQP